MGAGHARALSRIPNATLVAVSDLDPARSQKIAGEQNARPYGDWREMLETERDLDAVILATPAIVRREPIEAICEWAERYLPKIEANRRECERTRRAVRRP